MAASVVFPSSDTEFTKHDQPQPHVINMEKINFAKKSQGKWLTLPHKGRAFEGLTSLTVREGFCPIRNYKVVNVLKIYLKVQMSNLFS